MFLQKEIIAPRLARLFAAACELECQVLLAVDGHEQAKRQADQHRDKAAAGGGFPKLGKVLSILLSCTGIKDPQETAYLDACLTLRNQLVHGSYREVLESISQFDRLRIKDNVVTFDPPLGFAVPEFDTRLEAVLALTRTPGVCEEAVRILEGGHLLLGLRVNQHYERLHGLGSMMTIPEFPWPRERAG
ncbi:MAG TPA: hypothetical protein VHJ20_14510 [Polyangia bacterium]|nr:hypothetical protein [Polyangia bacterium]